LHSGFSQNHQNEEIKMKKQLLVIAVILLLFQGVGISNASIIQLGESGYYYEASEIYKFTSNNHYYQIFKSYNSIKWAEANSIANGLIYGSLPGHLATLTSIEEDSFAWVNLNSNYANTWIGGIYSDCHHRPKMNPPANGKRTHQTGISG
jgi:hypothetical protein